MYTIVKKLPKLLKEMGLDCGLVQTVYRPCAENLVALLDTELGQEVNQIKRVLDVGCGSGIVARVIVDYNVKQQRTIQTIHGLDLENAAIEVATIKTINDNRFDFEFWQDDATTFKPRGESYDLIITQHLIQHLDKNDDDKKSLECMMQALKPGGWLVLGVWPKLTSECEAYDFLYQAADQEMPVIGMELEDLNKLARSVGLGIIRSEEVKFETKPVKNRSEFLRQYFEGSLTWQERDAQAWRERFKALDKNDKLKRMGKGEEGNLRFDIKMNRILAKRQT